MHFLSVEAQGFWNERLRKEERAAGRAAQKEHNAEDPAHHAEDPARSKSAMHAISAVQRELHAELNRIDDGDDGSSSELTGATDQLRRHLQSQLAVLARVERLAGRQPADRHVRDAFRRLDADGSGRLDSRELRAALALMGVDTSAASAAAVLRRYDHNQSGALDIHEFAHLVSDLRAGGDGSGSGGPSAGGGPRDETHGARAIAGGVLQRHGAGGAGGAADEWPKRLVGGAHRNSGSRYSQPGPLGPTDQHIGRDQDQRYKQHQRRNDGHGHGRLHFDEDAEARWRSLVGGGGLGGVAGAGAVYGLPKTARPPTPPRPRAAHGSRSHLRPVSAHGARTDSGAARAARAARMHGGEGRSSGGGGALSSGWKEATDPRHSTPTHGYNKETRAISHARPESAPPRPPRPSSTRRGSNSGAAQERGGGDGGGGGGGGGHVHRWASAARGRDTVGFYDDAKHLEV